MTRKRKALWVVVGVVIAAVAVVVGLLVSTSGSPRTNGVASTSSDPHLTVAQATKIEAGISQELNTEVLPGLSGMAGPLESAIGSVDPSTGTDTSSASVALVSVASAAVKMASQTSEDFDQLPVAALAAQQKSMSAAGRSAEQSALDAAEPDLAAYQTDLSALNSLIAAAPALASVGDPRAAAVLDSDVTTSSTTPAVVSSFVSEVSQLESPATQLLNYLEADIQGNVYDIATTGYTAVSDELTLVNDIDSDMYVIRQDATDIVEQLTALARSTPITLGVVSGQATGGTTYQLDGDTQGQVCSGNPLDCWIMETPPGKGNENDGEWLSFWFGVANLAFGIIGPISLIVDVASLGASVPATAGFVAVQILTSVGQFYLDAERPLSSYEPPNPGLDKFVTITFDVLGVAFSVVGASAAGDAIKVDGAAEDAAKATKALKPLLEDTLAATVGKSESADKLLDDSEQLFQHVAELKKAGSIADAKNVVKTIIGTVSSVVLSYNGPLGTWLKDFWNFLQTRLWSAVTAATSGPGGAPLTWQARPQVLSFPADGNPTAVSCNAKDSCDVVTNTGDEVTVGSKGASTPQQIDPATNGGLDSVSCSNSGSCVAVDQAGKVTLHIFAPGAVPWTSPETIDPHTSTPRSNVHRAVSCTLTGDFCMLVDTSGYAYTYDANDGKWSSATMPDPKGGGLWSVSCATFQFCAATELDGAVITYDGHTWSAPDELEHDSLISAVSCPTTDFCAAVDQQGDAFTYNGHTWSDEPHIDTGTAESGQPAQFDSVSCPTSTFCEAVDSRGRVVSYQGTSWGHPTLVDPNAGNYRAAEAISCSSATFCVLVDGTGNVLVRAPGTTTPAPSWVSALGTGVTTVAPGSSPSPGNGSPGGVLEAEAADVNAGNLTAACSLLEPSAQAACTQATTGQSSSGVSYQNFGLGYIAIDGDDALVGTVGTYCNPNNDPACVTNSDPAAIFSSDQTFTTLFTAAVAAENSSSNSYSLAPLVEIGSAWYLDQSG